jgi:hypothetical protein
MRHLLALLGLPLLLTGCQTTRVTIPPRSATEQMLLSEASEAAALAIHLKLPEGSRAFLDTTNFDGVDAKYAVSAIRQSLLVQGNAILDVRTDADVVIEIRAGALSIDSISQIIGIPAVDLVAFSQPGIKLLTRSKTVGVAKFSLFAYSRLTGRLISIAVPVEGYSRRTQDAANVVSWTNASVRTIN